MLFSARCAVLALLVMVPACKPAASAGVTLASEPMIDITDEGNILVDIAMSGFKAQSEFEQKPTGFSAVLKRDGSEVAEAPMKASDGGYAVATIEKPDLTPGHYTLEIRSVGAPMSVTKVEVANLPCVGGSQKKSVLAYGPRVQASDTDKGFTIRPGRWLLRTGPKAWAARWVREEGNALITTTTGADEGPEGLGFLEEMSARPTAPGLCPIAYDTESYEVPGAVLAREGKYVVRVVREDGDPLEVHFVVNGSNEAGGAEATKVRSKAGFSRRTTWATLEAKPFSPDAAFTASLASVPKKRSKESKNEIDNPLKISGDEVRALLRKPELLDRRIAFNQLVLAAPPKGAKDADAKAHRAEVELTKKDLVKVFHEAGGTPWAESEMKDAFSVQSPVVLPPPAPPPSESAAPPSPSASSAATKKAPETKKAAPPKKSPPAPKKK